MAGRAKRSVRECVMLSKLLKQQKVMNMTPKPARAAKIDLNSANASELATLKNVGTVIAERIVQERQHLLLGPFLSWGDFRQRIKGFGSGKRFGMLKRQATIVVPPYEAPKPIRVENGVPVYESGLLQRRVPPEGIPDSLEQRAMDLATMGHPANTTVDNIREFAPIPGQPPFLGFNIPTNHSDYEAREKMFNLPNYRNLGVLKPRKQYIKQDPKKIAGFGKPGVKVDRRELELTMEAF